MQHMNFDTELFNHFAREDRKTSNDFSRGGALDVAYDHEALDEMTMQLAKIKSKALVDEVFTGENCSRRNGVSLEPTQFTDALEILKLKRSLFLQRIQLSQTDCESLKLFLDSRSVDIQASINSGTTKFSEGGNDPGRTNKDHHYTPLLEKYPILQPQGNIVVLRPAPKVMDSPKHVICSCSSLSSHQHPKGKDRKFKTSYFCLKDIKKRLKRALRNNHEKQQTISPISLLNEPPIMKCINTSGGDKMRHSSDRGKPRGSFDHAKMRDKLYEKDVSRVRKGRESSPSNETAIGKLKLSDDSHSKSQEQDIFQEAKKHLSERLRNVNNFTVLENCRTPKTLGRILCSPEHDMSLPPSLKWSIKHLSVVTECEPPLRSSMKIDQKSDDDDPMVSDIDDLRIQEDSSDPISKDVTNTRNDPETENSWISNSLKDSVLLATTSSRNQETGSLTCVSPSSSSTYSPQKIGSIEYGEEHQSPISVLEPLFMEDANTPKRSSSGQLQPLRIAFEDCDYITIDEAIQEYVRAVLQAAGFNWNDLLQSRPSQDEILNISFPYGDLLLQIKTDNDSQLLVDFVNDVLLEIYQHHFGCTVWTSSYIKPNTRSLMLEQHFIKQVVEDVKGAIFPELLHPTLDQLVGKDIDKTSPAWLDIRVEVEDLVNTIAEDLLEESIHDIPVMFSTL